MSDSCCGRERLPIPNAVVIATKERQWRKVFQCCECGAIVEEREMFDHECPIKPDENEA